jgi:TrwC relaxase
MRLSVTALGSAGDRPVGVVVGSIARYLVAPEPSPETPGVPSPGGGDDEGSVVRYYADRGDRPGRWLGQGARELGLAREADFDDFTSVLAGRDPRTGARLITARGSAGRVASLGTGTVARWGRNGEALYSVGDAARILGWTQADVRAAVAEGEHLAASRLLGTLTGREDPAGTATGEATGNRPGSDPGRDRDAATGTPAPGITPVGGRDATGNHTRDGRTTTGKPAEGQTDTTTWACEVS